MGKHHKELKNRLNELRKEVKMTQQSLAEAVEVSRKSINAIEKWDLYSNHRARSEDRQSPQLQGRGYLRVALSFIWSRLNGANGQAMNSEVIA